MGSAIASGHAAAIRYFQVLNALDALSRELDPKTFREVMNNHPNDPAAAVKALAAINRKKSDQLLAKAGLKQAAGPKAKKGWNSAEINASVRSLLDSGNSGK